MTSVAGELNARSSPCGASTLKCRLSSRPIHEMCSHFVSRIQGLDFWCHRVQGWRQDVCSKRFLNIMTLRTLNSKLKTRQRRPFSLTLPQLTTKSEEPLPRLQTGVHDCHTRHAGLLIILCIPKHLKKARCRSTCCKQAALSVTRCDRTVRVR